MFVNRKPTRFAEVVSGTLKKKMGRGGLERLPSWSGVRMFRKLAGDVGRGRWCLTRLWILVFTCASITTFISLSNSALRGAIVNPTKLELRHPHVLGGFRWERRTETIESLKIQLPELTLPDSSDNEALIKHHSRRPVDTSSLPGEEVETIVENLKDPPLPLPYIEDVVALPDSVDLFFVQNFADRTRISACNYGEQQKSRPRSVDIIDGRLAVSCTRPSVLQNPVKILDVSLDVDGGESPPLLPRVSYLEPLRWRNGLVYSLQSTEEDVILHAKGVHNSQSRKASEYPDLENFRCVFGESHETNVTAAALGVYRCAHPVLKEGELGERLKVQLLYKGNSVPSIVYYEGTPGTSLSSSLLDPVNLGPRILKREKTNRDVAKKKHLVCSCTMVWNMAKYLEEWVMYNSDLGVSKFFLYDNNSEDEIEAVVSSLEEFNVTRTRWPWVKTQEAGFSHCGVVAQEECTWIMFTDVDEFIFPKKWLPLTDTPAKVGATSSAAVADRHTPLASLIRTMQRKGKSLLPNLLVGQISVSCRNFGPSGLTANPVQGVTQGYTCREKKEIRHKSIVYFPAVKKSLQNVIHHFSLQPGYFTTVVDSKQAVVNHYKFQAWSEFETKFIRRASTYVADWRENKNMKSKDRPEGIDVDGKKPLNWETSHCYTNDTALKDYTRRRFGVLREGESELKLVWEP